MIINFLARIARLMIRIVLRVLFFVLFTIGITLLTVPFWSVLTPEMSLVQQKLISDMGGVVLVIVLAFGFLLLSIWLRGRLMDLQQEEHDRTAQNIMNQLRADPRASVAEFYLYLRAFETTGNLHAPLYLRLRKFSIGLHRLVTNDVESYVSNSVRGIGPFIALGRPGEAIGVGRILTEEKQWQTDIVTLMKRAKGILLVPSNQPGTLWEIETLQREDLLNKVVFIMPPRTEGEFDTKERWEVAREVMASHGLEAPEHQERGLLFEVGTAGKVTNLEPMLLNSARQVRESMKRLLSDDPPKGGLFKAISVADRRIRWATFWGWVETLRQLLPYAIAAVGLFLVPPDIGFDSKESWATVWNRTMTALVLAQDQ